MFDIFVLVFSSLIFAFWINGLTATRQNFQQLQKSVTLRYFINLLAVVFIYPLAYEIGYSVGFIKAFYKHIKMYN